MRTKVTVDKLRQFMKCLARYAAGPGSVFFTGGATALLLGIRESTIDIDLKLDPEPKGVFEAIAKLKNELDLNIELAAPDDFIPAPSDWREKSVLIDTIGGISFFHYDLATQALAKLERSHDQDLRDVRALIKGGFVTPDKIRRSFLETKTSLLRYPALDAGEFERKVSEFLDEYGKEVSDK